MTRKNVFHKISLTMIFSLMFLIICSTAAFSSGIYYNATPVANSKEKTFTYHAQGDEIFIYPSELYEKCFSGEVKLSKIKFLTPSSSKTSVATIAYYNNYMYRMVVKKSGTTNITLKYKINGKTSTIKFPVTFKKKSIPFTTLKIGGKDLIERKNYVKVTSTTAKLTYKMKKNWEVTTVEAYSKIKNRWYQMDGTPVSNKAIIKSGTSIPIKKGVTQLYFRVHNKKTDSYQLLIFHVHR